ncbi:MAG TPA: hypothetical protein VLB04_12480 [Methanotrichaceae archaeon]|nr:hypothetical protein [Methanotrichaceae archaeon]
MRYSSVLERFLEANEGKLIWVILKDSGDTLLGRLEEYEEEVIVLNIAERQGEHVDITDVLLIFDLDSVFGFTVGVESLEVFNKSIEDARRTRVDLRRRMDEREIA